MCTLCHLMCKHTSGCSATIRISMKFIRDRTIWNLLKCARKSKTVYTNIELFFTVIFMINPTRRSKESSYWENLQWYTKNNYYNNYQNYTVTNDYEMDNTTYSNIYQCIVDSDRLLLICVAAVILTFGFTSNLIAILTIIISEKMSKHWCSQGHTTFEIQSTFFTEFTLWLADSSRIFSSFYFLTVSWLFRDIFWQE